MPIIFSDADIRVRLTNRRKLKLFIENVLCKEEGFTILNLSYVFCSDAYLLDINQRFLNHNYFTDIITFDMGTGAKGVIEGEVYISFDRVKDNAQEHGVVLSQELLRVIFHGVLHLCGYKDKTVAQQRAMRAGENKYLYLYQGFTG